MTGDEVHTQYLFAYGTLQLESVQMAAFGRRLFGTCDGLRGFELAEWNIEDQAVIAMSGTAQHSMAKFTGRTFDVISGTAFAVSAGELRHADRYEVSAVIRAVVVLRSRLRAWAYVDARRARPNK